MLFNRLYYPDLSLKRQYIERSLEAIEIGKYLSFVLLL